MSENRMKDLLVEGKRLAEENSELFDDKFDAIYNPKVTWSDKNQQQYITQSNYATYAPKSN